jgi:hypothetical protein
VPKEIRRAGGVVIFPLPLEELGRKIYHSFTTGVVILQAGKASPCFDHILRITILESRGRCL